jgi:hypothetical protein
MNSTVPKPSGSVPPIVDELTRLLNEKELAAARGMDAIRAALGHLHLGDTEGATGILLFALSDYNLIDEKITHFCESQRKVGHHGNTTQAA